MNDDTNRELHARARMQVDYLRELQNSFDNFAKPVRPVPPSAFHTKPEWDEFHPTTSTDFSAEHGTPKPKEEVKIDKS